MNGRAYRPKANNTAPASTGKKFTLRVEEDGTLLPFLQAKLKGHSNSSLKNFIKHRQVFLPNGTALTSTESEVKKGQVIEIRSIRGNRGNVLEHPKLKILFEDDYLIVVEKKEGLLSVRAPRQLEESATHILNQYLRGKRGRGNHIFVAHRLDKETSGVMLFVKDQQAQQTLRENWHNMVKQRSYVAVAVGNFEQQSGTIRSYLTEDIHQKMHSSPTDNGGQLAITHYKVLRAGKRYSLVQLNLETGRKNQIRVHLADLGHPVAGDLKYSGASCPANRLCLHAETLEFIHPVTNKKLRFEVPHPKSFDNLVN